MDVGRWSSDKLNSGPNAKQVREGGRWSTGCLKELEAIEYSFRMVKENDGSSGINESCLRDGGR
jgi:hypothetical protein